MENNRDITDYYSKFIELITTFISDIREEIERIKNEDLKNMKDEQRKDIREVERKLNEIELRLTEVKQITDVKKGLFKLEEKVQKNTDKINVWHGGLVVINIILGLVVGGLVLFT